MNGIMKYINRLSRTTGVFYNSRLRDYGIGQCHHPYILLICREPGIPQEKISREICVNKSNVTRQLTALEEKGLIIRKQDSNDRRVWRVYPTEKMQQLLPVVRQVMGEWNEYLLEELSQQEREVLVQALEKVTARANEAARELLGGRERQP
ncbi:MarR family transcriptional regulator [uncultured Negativibacillus sp.]|uniref:MarR family winged helix-turn-helix transcriptional regulator n=1 Tax=uncultured Negativibacillus sp. TaxID=1980696 RepID=UPI0025E547B2|nr:MarR family transcriptional regulator [uncultured Negativibacillus sp.]